MEAWIESLKARHREVFDSRDWTEHVRGLNLELGLLGRSRFTESRWAPGFFYAALPQFRSGSWLAVVSLNPKEFSEKDRAWHEAELWDSDASWDYLTRVDLRGFTAADYYYKKWCYPLLLLMATLTADEVLLATPEDSYLNRVGAFELIPYASHEYVGGTFARMSEDAGSLFSRDLMIETVANRPPVAIVANGLDAVAAVAEWLPLDRRLEEHRYESAHQEGKTLRHWQSSVSLGAASIPFAGFPFLRTQSGHNAFEEIRQLGREIVARV